MDAVLKDTRDRMQKSIQALEEELNTIRTGRASAALFERVKVEYYGNPTPLNQVATISVPEARLVVIQPWDKGIINEIEKAIQKSELSVNPSNDGKVIRINIPPLTEERRKEYVKVAKNMAEQARVAIRNIRRDALQTVKELLKEKEISEDDDRRAHEEIQQLTDKHIAIVDKVVEEKEQELLEV